MWAAKYTFAWNPYFCYAPGQVIVIHLTLAASTGLQWSLWHSLCCVRITSAIVIYDMAGKILPLELACCCLSVKGHCVGMCTSVCRKTVAHAKSHLAVGDDFEPASLSPGMKLTHIWAMVLWKRVFIIIMIIVIISVSFILHSSVIYWSFWVWEQLQ